MKYRGVAYYPEYWPEERWQEDIRLMREAHINLVRVGEFAWCAMEPAEGCFTLDWLHRLVAGMGANGINVLLCTPTATPPAWLTQQYAETRLVHENGQVMEHGRRRHYCPTNHTYRHFSRRITDLLSREFSRYANVVAWQLDNEFGPEGGNCFCEHCQAQFRHWLQRRYGTLEALNRAWGTRFWSVEYSAWEQVRQAYGDMYSAALLDTRRFKSDNFVDFAAEQARIIRGNHAEALVVTNGMGPLFEPINYYDLFNCLDRACDDLYFDIGTLDTDVLAMNLYRQYKPDTPFWLTETGSGALTADKCPAPGQVRAWAYSSLAHGGEAHCVFRWRTCLSGQEQELQGVIEVSGKPRRRYQTVQALFAELEELWPQLADAPLPAAQVAIIHDYQSMWGCLSSRVASAVQYFNRVYQLHKVLFDRNVPVDVIPPGRDLSRYRLLLLPPLLMVDAAFADSLRAFVAGGGMIFSLPQLASRDANDNYLPACPPVGLQDLFGLRVEGGMYLRDYNGPDEALWVPDARPREVTPAVRLALAAGEVTGTVANWMEDIELEGGTALGTYTDSDFAGSPFYVAHCAGAGQTRYCAAYPSTPLLEALLTDTLQQADVPLGLATPPWVEVVRRGAYTFIINHRDEPVTVPCPATRTLLGKYQDGQAVLEAYGVCILQEG